MNIDLRTLFIVLVITDVIQAIALFLQYLLNKTYRGIGWWVLGFAMEAIGFILLLLQDFISIDLISIILANALLVSGVIFIYIGIMRFLDKKENRGIVISIFAVFILAYFYFTYVNNDITIRSFIASAALAVVSFLTALGLFVNKPRSITTSANFVSLVLLAHSCFFISRAVVLLTVSPIDSIFSQTLMQTAVFLVQLIEGILLTFGLIIMVNQRLNAEAREAKDHFELIFNTSPDVAQITRLRDGLIVNVNEGFTALSGFTRDEAIGKSSLEINLWKDPADRQKMVNELEEKGHCQDFEAVFQRKDGGQFFGLMSAKIITMQGQPYIITVTRDITERKLAQQLLQGSQKKFQSLVETTSDFIWEMDLHGVYTYCSPQMEKLWRLKPEEMLGKSPFDLLPPEGRERTIKAFSALAETGSPFVNMEVPSFDGTGQIRFLEISGVPFFDTEGKLGGYRGITRDITERKQLEDTIKVSETKYKTLFEFLPLGITVSDKAGNIKESNKESERLLGLSQEIQNQRQIDGQEWQLVRTDGSPMPADEYASVRALKENRTIKNVQMGIVKGEGVTTWINVTASPIPLPDLGVIIAYTDITELMEADEKIKSLAKFPDENPNPVLRIAKDGTILYANRVSQILLDTWNCSVGQRLRGYWLQVVSEVIDSGLQKITDCACGERLFSLLLIPIVSEGYTNIYSLDITDHRKSEEQVSKSRQEMRALSRRLQSLREEERTLLARELHDDLGQALTAMKLDLSWLSRRLPPKPETLQKIEFMSQLIDASMATVKRVSSNLRPGLLDDLGLQAAMEWYIQEFQQRAGIKCRATFVPEDLAIEPELATAIFRIVQEALTNIASHAQATRIGISLREEAGIVELIVKDNGIGIDPKLITSPRSLGIIGMKERASALGGKLEISGSSKGTTVTVCIPQDMGGGGVRLDGENTGS